MLTGTAVMVYMHRSSFVQALKDRPNDPLAGPYAASFLAAYRGALLIVKSDLKSFSLYPEQFHRWWPIWKSCASSDILFIIRPNIASNSNQCRRKASPSYATLCL